MIDFDVRLGAAALILNYGPLAAFGLALLLMITTLILVGACKYFLETKTK